MLDKIYPHRKAIAGFLAGFVFSWLAYRDGGVTSDE